MSRSARPLARAVLFLLALVIVAGGGRAQESYFDSEKTQPDANSSGRTTRQNERFRLPKQKGPEDQINPTPGSETRQREADLAIPDLSTEFTEESGPGLEWGGFLRQAVYGYQSALPADQRTRKELISSWTRARLFANYDATDSDWKARISANLDGVFANYSDSYEFDFHYKRQIRNRLFSLEGMRDEDEFLLKADVHKLWWAGHYGKWDIKLGRQSLSWGQGRLINPLDLVTPAGPFVQDLEDVPGADFAHSVYSISNYQTLELVLQPVRRASQSNLRQLHYQDLNALIRYKGSFGATDWSLLGGRHFHSWVFGSEVSHTRWGAALRAAWLARHEARLTDYDFYDNDQLPPVVSHQLNLGISYAFWGTLRTNLEVLINTACLLKDPAYASHVERAHEQELTYDDQRYSDDQSFFRSSGRVITKQPYLIQSSIDYELKDVYRPGLVVIFDPEGESLFLGPAFSWDFADEGVWTIGASLFEEYQANKDGEFKDLPPMAYTFIRFHF
ncbi:MAG: hypothetical protein KDK39_01630 [Leptospiraceae bacterium]|nr:hypothetical protein [Leptospiraceae bacterium]